MIDFDFVLTKIGSFKLYQILMLIAMTYCGFPLGLASNSAVFISYVPAFRCLMEPFDNSAANHNATRDYIWNITTPLDENGVPVDACVRYGYSLTDCIIHQNFSCVNVSEQLIPCEGYFFDKTLFYPTAVTEFQLVCDREGLDVLVDTLFMIGNLVGSIMAGNAADRFGRRNTGVVTAVGCLSAMLLTAYSASYVVFTSARVLTAVFGMGFYMISFIYVLELVDSHHRTPVGILVQLGYPLGYLWYSGITYLFRDWHQMQLAVVVICAPALLIFLVIPESPRWLFSKAKDEEGKRVVRKMAKINGVQLSSNIWNESEIELGADKDIFSTIDLFRWPSIRLLTIKVGTLWAVNMVVYYGVALNAGSLSGNIFLNNLYAGCIEIFCCILVMLIMDHVSRSILLSSLLLGAGLCLLVNAVLDIFVSNEDGLKTLSSVLCILGRGMVGAAYVVTYNFTAELYPTVIRTNGFGFASVCANVGGILSPVMIAISSYGNWLPSVVFAAISVIGGIVCLSIRDTSKIRMMETVEEAVIFHSRKDNNMKRCTTERLTNQNPMASVHEIWNTKL